MHRQVRGLKEVGCGHQRGNEDEGGGLDEQVKPRSLLQAQGALGKKEVLSLGHNSP